MSETAIFKKSYFTNKKNGVFVEEENGVCQTFEYEINGKAIRFIVSNLDMMFHKRTARTYTLKEIQDEQGNWSAIGEGMVLQVSDDFFINTADGQVYPADEAYEFIDDTEKPIAGTDPIEYQQKRVLKDGYISEVDFLHAANSGMQAIVEQNIKTKIENSYNG